MKTNNIRLNLSLVTTLTGLALLSLTGNSALAANWTITDLGALGAPYNWPFESWAYNINNAGQVAGKGVVLIDGVLQNHYVMWSNGTQIDLGIRINSSWVDSAPINDAGQVAGVIEAEGYRPFLWHAGVVTRLPWLPGSIAANVASINASGTMVGFNRVWRGGGQADVAVKWEGGILTQLEPECWDKAVAVNDSGAIAIREGPARVLVGGATSVVEVSGMHEDYGLAQALDLNNAGQVCGRFTVDMREALGYHAFLWQGGVGTPLPESLPGGVSSQNQAVALNNLGHAIGQVINESGYRAVLWRDGTIINLSALPEVTAAGWWSLVARDINDHGQIVGIGYHGGPLTAFLLSPVVVPSLTITRSGTEVVVSFPTQTGVSYQLQSSTSLQPASWLNVGVPYSGNGSVQSASVTIGPEPEKFFRLQLGN